MVFQNLVPFIGVITALLTLLKGILEFKNILNGKVSLKNYKESIKYIVISAILFILGIMLFMGIILVAYSVCSFFISDIKEIESFLVIGIAILLVLGAVLFFIKYLIEKKYYLKIDYDLTYNSKKSNKIYEEMLEISKDIEKFRKNKDIENYKRALNKLNQLYNSKGKFNKLTRFYNFLKSFNYMIFYPAIIILYTYFAIEDKLIYTWFFYVAITLLTIGLISMIFFDISKNNSKFKVTKNMLEKHLKRYNKEADKMKPPNLKLLTEKRSFLKRIFYFNKRL